MSQTPKPRIHLLSEEDLFCISSQGAPTEIRPELTQLQGNGSVIFTMRGIQFYRYALQQYRLDIPLHTVRTGEDVLRMHVDLCASAFSHLVAQLDPAGLGTDQGRAQVQALVRGSLEAIAQAANRLRPSMPDGLTA